MVKITPEEVMRRRQLEQASSDELTDIDRAIVGTVARLDVPLTPSRCGSLTGAGISDQRHALTISAQFAAVMIASAPVSLRITDRPPPLAPNRTTTFVASGTRLKPVLELT